MVFDPFGCHRAWEPEREGLGGEFFNHSVEPFSKLLEEEEGVAFCSRIEATGEEVVEDVVYIGEVEVAAKAETSHFSARSAQKRVNLAKTGSPCCAVTQMSKIDLSFPRHIHVGSLLGFEHCFAGTVEDFLDTSVAEGTFAKDELLTGRCSEVDTRNAGSFLAPIALLLHEQIERIEPPVWIAACGLGPAKQPYHCNATLVL